MLLRESPLRYVAVLLDVGQKMSLRIRREEGGLQALIMLNNQVSDYGVKRCLSVQFHTKRLETLLCSFLEGPSPFECV